MADLTPMAFSEADVWSVCLQLLKEVAPAREAEADVLISAALVAQRTTMAGATVAATADGSSAEGLESVVLSLHHDCRHRSCADRMGCELCRCNPMRPCLMPLHSRYFAKARLVARCSAPVLVRATAPSPATVTALQSCSIEVGTVRCW